MSDLVCVVTDATLAAKAETASAVSATRGSAVSTRLVRLLRGALMRFRLWRRVRRDEALLMKQPDYMLRDMGIGRGEIESAIRGDMRWRRWRP